MAAPTITPVAEQYIALAKSGEKLDADQRRHAITYLLAKGDGYTNVEFGQMFDVDEKTIRRDMVLIKTAQVEDVRETTDVKLVIADLCAARDRALVEIDKMKKKMRDSGKDMTPLFARLIQMPVEVHLKVTQALQDMGWVPKTLGTMTHRHHFRAVVNKGVAETRRVDLFDDIRDGETLEDSLKRQASAQKALVESTDIVDAEFEDLPTEMTGNDQSENPNQDAQASTQEGTGTDHRVDPGTASASLGATESPNQCVEAPLRPAN
jgi:hypothetical protein